MKMESFAMKIKILYVKINMVRENQNVLSLLVICAQF